jgi:transposase
MSGYFWLSDKAWAVIAPHLPRNQPVSRSPATSTSATIIAL